jgi:signal transduction histidine kinase
MWCAAVQSLSFGPDGAGEPAGTGRDVLEIVAEQAALRRVATLVARGVSHEELFAVVNQELARLVGADAAALLRFEPDQTITLLAGWTAAGAPVPEGEREPLTAALRRLRDTARPVRFGPADVPLTGPFITEIRRLGIRAAVAVPVQAGGRVWGVSVAASQSPEPFPPATETRMAAFAELVATAISNAESRAELAASRTRAIAAADESRRRIQRDLHDGDQQRLADTILRLQLAKAELVGGIMPAALRQGGLRAAVRALLHHIGLPVSVEVMPDRLPAHVETTAYFVIVEALTNAVKHARATGAGVRAAVCHGALELEIRDDGPGGADPRHRRPSRAASTRRNGANVAGRGTSAAVRNSPCWRNAALSGERSGNAAGTTGPPGPWCRT